MCYDGDNIGLGQPLPPSWHSACIAARWATMGSFERIYVTNGSNVPPEKMVFVTNGTQVPPMKYTIVTNISGIPPDFRVFVTNGTAIRPSENIFVSNIEDLRALGFPG
jgi:hypothetical protein